MPNYYKPIRLIVCGTRTFNDYAYLKRKLDKHYFAYRDVTVLSGTAKGPDALGERWAYEWWHVVMRYHPDYDTHGKAAPIYRNQEMVENATHFIAFWDGKSNGTKDIIRRARKWGLKVKIIRFDRRRHGP
jgi:hypothetical protein